jgi:hypothetical protein
VNTTDLSNTDSKHDHHRPAGHGASVGHHERGTTVMSYLAATLHTMGVCLTDAVTSRRPRSERGSVTIEQVLWAVAVIAIVGIVVLAVTNYVTTQAAKIT